MSVDFVSSIIHVRSARCHGSWTNSARCIACTDLDSDIEIVENWALQSFGKKSTGRLNHLQLEEKIKSLARQLQAEQLKVTHLIHAPWVYFS